MNAKKHTIYRRAQMELIEIASEEKKLVEIDCVYVAYGKFSIFFYILFHFIWKHKNKGAKFFSSHFSQVGRFLEF